MMEWMSSKLNGVVNDGWYDFGSEVGQPGWFLLASLPKSY
jgi:hypothetical protein